MSGWGETRKTRESESDGEGQGLGTFIGNASNRCDYIESGFILQTITFCNHAIASLLITMYSLILQHYKCIGLHYIRVFNFCSSSSATPGGQARHQDTEMLVFPYIEV